MIDLSVPNLYNFPTQTTFRNEYIMRDLAVLYMLLGCETCKLVRDPSRWPPVGSAGAETFKSMKKFKVSAAQR